ncbi:hypothetical protein FIBSPDRAFT_1038727, partial [Athelia psychrophila]
MSYALPGAHTEELDVPARLVDGASCEEDSVQVQQSITDPAYTRPKCDRACMLRSPTGNTAPHTRAQTPPGPTAICTSVLCLMGMWAALYPNTPSSSTLRGHHHSPASSVFLRESNETNTAQEVGMGRTVIKGLEGGAEPDIACMVKNGGGCGAGYWMTETLFLFGAWNQITLKLGAFCLNHILQPNHHPTTSTLYCAFLNLDLGQRWTFGRANREEIHKSSYFPSLMPSFSSPLHVVYSCATPSRGNGKQDRIETELKSLHPAWKFASWRFFSFPPDVLMFWDARPPTDPPKGQDTRTDYRPYRMVP